MTERVREAYVKRWYETNIRDWAPHKGLTATHTPGGPWINGRMAAAIMSAQLRRNIILIDVNSWILNGSLSTTVFQNAEGANQQRVEEVFYCRCACGPLGTSYVADSDSEHEGPRATQHCTCDWRNDATIYAAMAARALIDRYSTDNVHMLYDGSHYVLLDFSPPISSAPHTRS